MEDAQLPFDHSDPDFREPQLEQHVLVALLHALADPGRQRLLREETLHQFLIPEGVQAGDDLAHDASQRNGAVAASGDAPEGSGSPARRGQRLGPDEV